MHDYVRRILRLFMLLPTVQESLLPASEIDGSPQRSRRSFRRLIRFEAGVADDPWSFAEAAHDIKQAKGKKLPLAIKVKAKGGNDDLILNDCCDINDVLGDFLKPCLEDLNSEQKGDAMKDFRTGVIQIDKDALTQPISVLDAEFMTVEIKNQATPDKAEQLNQKNKLIENLKAVETKTKIRVFEKGWRLNGAMGIVCDEKGVVQEVTDGGPADKKEIKKGDTILYIDKKPYSKENKARAEKKNSSYVVWIGKKDIPHLRKWPCFRMWQGERARLLLMRAKEKMSIETLCMDAFMQQVKMEVPCSNYAITVPDGVMLLGDNVTQTVEAFRCPSQAACVGSRHWIGTVSLKSSASNTSMPGVCPLRELAHNRSQVPMCATGYEGPGCVRCMKSYGRNHIDAYVCEKCPSVCMQWVSFALKPLFLLVVGIRGAIKAMDDKINSKTRGKFNDILKIFFAYSNGATLVMSMLLASKVTASLSSSPSEAVRFAGMWAGVGAVLQTSSIDCLLGVTSTPNIILVAVGIAKAMALLIVLVFGVGLLRLKRTDITYFQCLIIAFIVWGSQFMPEIAGAAARNWPCYHLQKTGAQHMVWSANEDCHVRFHPRHAGSSFLVCLFAIGMGPLFQYWVVQNEGDKWTTATACLTYGYREGCRSWDCVRLVRTMAIAMVGAGSPISYCPVQAAGQLQTVLLMSVVIHFHAKPYNSRLLNAVEGLSIVVVIVAMIGAIYVTSENWSNTLRAREVVFGLTAFLLVAHTCVLMGLIIWTFGESLGDTQQQEVADGKTEQCEPGSAEPSKPPTPKESDQTNEGAHNDVYSDPLRQGSPASSTGIASLRKVRVASALIRRS